MPPALGCTTVAVPFWHLAPRRRAALEPVKRTSASCGPLLWTVTWNPSAGTALFNTTALPWHVTVIDPPAFENVVVAIPGVTDVAVCVVVVVVCPGGGVTVETTGVVLVVVVATVGVRPTVGNVVLVLADALWSRTSEVDGLDDGPVSCVGEDEGDVVGMLQVVRASPGACDEGVPRASPGAGMTGSGGEAIALVTAPTPTQLTTVAAAVATAQAAIGSGLTGDIQLLSPPQPQVRTKATIIRAPVLEPVSFGAWTKSCVATIRARGPGSQVVRYGGPWPVSWAE